MTFLHDDPGFEDLLQIVAAKRSLSKGFGIIERFSEDLALDLKVEPGPKGGLPRIENWKSEGKAATAMRREYFEALRSSMSVGGASVWMEGTTLVGLEKGRVVRALEGWG